MLFHIVLYKELMILIRKSIDLLTEILILYIYICNIHVCVFETTLILRRNIILKSYY